MGLRRRLVPYWLLGPGLLWLIVFFVVPMYFMGELALRSGSLTTGFTFDWAWSNFPESLSGHTQQISRSFFYAGTATLLSLLIAYPLAYAIAFRAGRFKLLLLFAVIAPFFTTYLIRTIAWKTILFDDGTVVNALQAVGLAQNGRVLATSGSVIAGLTYNFLPFMILPLYANLERLDLRLVEAAKDLYSSSRQAFLKVTLPLTMPGIVAGVLLTFIPAFGDYINAYILGGTQNAMIGNVIQSLYLNQRDYPEAAALSFLMMALILAIVVVYIRFAGTGAFLGDDDEEPERAPSASEERRRRWPGSGVASSARTLMRRVGSWRLVRAVAGAWAWMGNRARQARTGLATLAARARTWSVGKPAAGAWAWIRHKALPIYAALAIFYMLIPIIVIVVFSFGATPKGKLTFGLNDGFTTEYWSHAFALPDLNEALLTSLRLAALATVISTAIGTLMAIALVRHRFHGRRLANLLIVIPMATPEVVIGASLLSMFIYVKAFTLGFQTLLIAHVMFCISFVVVVVRSRLIGFDRHIEEAAADLGATPLATFRTVTLPLLAPGILAAAMLAFALSIDDFVISNFNSGNTVTFPLYVYGVSLRGIPVQVNVLATILFSATVIAAALVLFQQRRAQRMTAVRPEQEVAPALPLPA